jgi:hypothetical protein
VLKIIQRLPAPTNDNGFAFMNVFKRSQRSHGSIYINQ